MIIAKKKLYYKFLNVRFKYPNEALFHEICANLHTFLVQKSKHWMKSVSKFLFNFFDILESKVFTEGILGIAVCHFIIQKILRTDRKQYILKIFGGIKCCI